MVNSFTEIQQRNEESDTDNTDLYDNDSNDELSDSENEKIEEELFNLVELTRDNTQLRYIASVFQNNIGIELTSRVINTMWTLNNCFSQTKKTFNKEDWANIESNDDVNKALQKTFLNNDVELPGDVQRQLRTFKEKFHKYGLECNNNDRTPIYTWNPKPISALDTIISPAARNIFKNKKEKEQFKKEKKNICEICETKADRMAIDHWRAHSTYNIDNKNIAVLLCETCNNIHKNYDASNIFVNKKYIDIYKCYKNWLKKEKEITDKGFSPNEEDKIQQKNNISKYTNYWKNYLKNEEVSNMLDKLTL